MSKSGEVAQGSQGLSVRVYSPESSIRRPHELLRAMFEELWSGRDLAWRLAVRDVSAMYRQTMLGFMWLFIMPLLNTVTWIFLNSSGIVKVAETDIPYPAYVFSGTMLWGILSEALRAPLDQTNQARSMLSKLNFSKEALIVAGVYKTLFNTAVKVLLLLGGLLALGVYPDLTLLLFPLGILSLTLAGTAIGLLLTPIGLLYQDIGRGLPLLMQFLMYLTPVVFVMPESGWAAWLIRLNPMTPLIVTTRDWLTGVTADFTLEFCAVNALVLIILFVAWVVYRAAMPMLIERLDA